MTTRRRIITWLLVPPMLLATGFIGRAIIPFGRRLLSAPHARWYVLSAVLSALFFSIFKPKAMYVFGHEATHWLFAKLTGHETGRFTCHGARGYVEIKNPTLLIVLAPYFIPFYFLILGGLYGLFVTFFPRCLSYWGTVACGCIIAAAFAFHCVMTVYALWHGQSDLKPYGFVFSIAFILVMNALLGLFTAWIACHGIAGD